MDSGKDRKRLLQCFVTYYILCAHDKCGVFTTYIIKHYLLYRSNLITYFGSQRLYAYGYTIIRAY